MVITDTAEAVTFSAAEFDVAFPFHVAFDRLGTITRIGRSLGKTSPTLRVGMSIAETFLSERPRKPLDVVADGVVAGRLYIIRERATGILLRGQMLGLQNETFFLGSPWVADSEELEKFGLTLTDFAVHDPTLDLLQVLQLQKISTEDMQRLTARLREQGAQLELTGRMKDAFLASVSHELRTPLTSIIGLSESMSAEGVGPVTEAQARYLNIIATSGRRLLTVVNDILDLAKLQAGYEKLARRSTPVEQICRMSLETIHPFATRRGHRVTFENNVPDLEVAVDARRIKQAIDNLLENAVKFTPPQGELGVKVSADDHELRIQVWDRGIGISADDLKKLFRPFVQLDDRLARRFDGTGLGLALVKLVVELHGGRVEVDSVPGSGSRFSIILPVETPAGRE